ncbi:MAG TPA: hypothetical protein VEZ12_19430 [Herpetosiphonaceae bacterium]|nr:hypothetical protein [Herpetosiphonaceae bacterium]
MKGQTRRSIAIALIALVLGLLGAFVVAVSVLADGAWTERRFLILAILAGYGLAGFLAGWLAGSWHPALWLIFPALPALILFAEDTTFALVYFALIATCTILGAWAGAWTHVRRQGTRS